MSPIFVGNVAYRRSQGLEEFLAKMGGKIKIVCFSLYTPDLNPGGATEAVQKIYLELPVPKYQWGAKVHTRDAKEKRDSDCKNERVFASLTPHLVITWN